MNDPKLPMASELIQMLQTAIDTYGDRPVKVEINDKLAIVNDLKFSTKGNDYILFLGRY